MNDGATLWEREIDNDRVVGQNIVVKDSTVYVPLRGPASVTNPTKTAYVYALDARTGQTKWRTAVDYPDLTGLVMDTKGILYFGSSYSTSMYALDTKTHTILWKQQAKEGKLVSNVISVSDGSVYFEQGINPGNGLNLYLVALDTKTGTQKWLSNAISGSASVSLVKYGLCFVSTEETFVGGEAVPGTIIGIDLTNGTQSLSISYEDTLGVTGLDQYATALIA